MIQGGRKLLTQSHIYKMKLSQAFNGRILGKLVFSTLVWQINTIGLQVRHYLYYLFQSAFFLTGSFTDYSKKLHRT